MLAALVPQQTPFELKVPRSWKHVMPKKKYRGMNLNIQFVPLPTYASWLNGSGRPPIEKVWKYLKKQLIHNHRFAHSIQELSQHVNQMMAAFSQGSEELLSFCGLLNPDGIYAKSLRIKTANI